MKERVSEEKILHTRLLLGEIQEDIESSDNLDWVMFEEAKKLIDGIIDKYEELEHLLEK